MLKAQVVVIGSGVAGALTAYTLAKKGLKVLMLEAGPRIEREDIIAAFSKRPQMDFSAGYPNLSSAPRPDWSNPKDHYIENTGQEKLQIEYLRVLGGTTWHWNANAIRFQPAEMSMHSRYGVGIDWPIDYASLEPFYYEAEKEMGVSGDRHADDGAPRSQPFPMLPIPASYCDNLIAKALRPIGIHFIPAPAARNSSSYQGRSICQGFGTCAPICPSGAQYSAMVHVELAIKAGVQIIENARVDRLEVEISGKITSAQVSLSDGTKFVVQGDVFVIAANGIESPKLLMMSVSEHYPNGLANSSGQVGRNFMEHHGMNGQFVLPNPAFSGRGPQNITFSNTFRDGAFRNKRAGYCLSVNNVARVHEIAEEYINNGLKPPELDKAIRDRAIHQVEIESQMEQLPDTDNALTLNWNQRDSSGQPQMHLHCSLSDYEQAGLTHIRATFSRIATSLNAKSMYITPSYGHHHPMGMTRMGSDARNSVVDAYCCTHDHKNLFVLSSSVFPTGGAANPTLTIAALSLRSAQEIVRRTYSG